MNAKTTNLRRGSILATNDPPEDRGALGMSKQWQQRLGYCSIFAAVPAVIATQVQATSSDEPKEPAAIFADRSATRQNLRFGRRNSALLKRQSEFRLPHQEKRADAPATFAGTDDCPGGVLPAGNYTSTSPLTVSGDTTSANSSIDTLAGWYYYFYGDYNAYGPDHIYSLTVTSYGSNPRIEISTTSGTYRPLIYLLPGGKCPIASTKRAESPWFYNDSRWSNGVSGSARIDLQIPPNTPFYLVVDSSLNDSAAVGPYTLRLQDVTLALSPACSSINPIDCLEPFVRQQYVDFLAREPDTIGFQNWVSTLVNCENGGYGEFDNPQCDRVHVSAGFVQSYEFQGRGYWLLRFGYVGLNRSIGSVRSSLTYAEFVPGLQQIGGQNSPAQEEAAKVVFADAFVQRSDFQALFPNSMSNSQYVSALESNAGVNLPNQAQLISALDSGAATRAQVLRSIVESQAVFDKYIIPSFVDMEYKGYLRRDPDLIGYQNWVNTLTADPSNYRHMVFGFIYSTEYRQRFGTP